jgi:type III secretory pathway component EscS
MGKTFDIAQILIIVIIGMFIPFLGSILITFELDFTNIYDLLKIGKTFVWFLVIFAIELVAVFIYFYVSQKIAGKKLNEYKPK